jgi:hypothetical protein
MTTTTMTTKGADDHDEEDPSKGGNTQAPLDGRGDHWNGINIAEDNVHQRQMDQEDN